ncbi:MAG: 5'-methylthioadenosine/adenosylhomocysteine nucleosidase [Defluviitaleaceae bacterium]|nr:5'-methylthioadenosine/adenosylhomocysteine nucleosidase [Defluviitaleaceae bacterium]
MIGIIGAMDIEVTAFIRAMSDTSTKIYSGITYVKGRFSGVDVVVAKCGMGKVNSAICAQTMILMYSPTVVINIGVAGSISPTVKVGDIVIGKEAVQHDLDLSPIGLKRGFIQEMNTIFIPCTPDITIGLKGAAENIDCTCHTGVIATGDQFISCKKTKNEIFENFNALACEMEGASIAQVCALNKIPFGIVRTISDNADGDSASDFTKFLHEAAQKSIQLITAFIGNKTDVG